MLAPERDPPPLIERTPHVPVALVSEYDVTHDGRFLIIEREPGPYTLTMLMNWAPAGP